MTPWTAAQQTSLSLTNSWSLPKFMSVKLVTPSNHLISVTLFSFCLQSSRASESFPLSQLVKVLELQLQHRSFQKYSGLISFKIDRFDLFSLLQHYSSKASVQCSAFFMGQLSHSYMTTGKTIALNIRTFVRKLMSLLNILI